MKYSKISSKAEDYVFTVILVISFSVIALCFLGSFLLGLFWTAKYNVILYGLVLIDVILTMIAVIFVPKVIHENYGYYTDEKKLEARSGIFYINRKVVLFRNVYKVTITRKIIASFFGIYSIILSTSAGKVRVSYLDEKQVDKLFAIIERRIHE